MDKEKEKWKKLNDDILKRMKMGENLQDPAKNTWYPPRPTIPKNQEHVKKLYGNNVKIVGITKLEIIKEDTHKDEDRGEDG